MGSTQRTVGGGATTGTANAFQDFLRQQLGAPSQADSRQNVVNMIRNSGYGGLAPSTVAHNTQLNSNAGQPGQQTSAFGSAFQNAMSGQINDQSGSGQQLQNYFAGGPQYGQQYDNQYQNQQYQGFDPTQLATNFGQGQTGMADLSGYGNIQNTNVDVMQGFGQRGQSGMDPFMQQMFGQSQNMMQGGGPSGVGAQNVDMANGLSYADAYNQLGQDPLMERNRMLAVADQRARFGAEGAGALGTGAQFAEGTLNAQLNAQDASNRRGQSMQLMGQDLANRQALAGVGLQNAGNNLQSQIATVQGGLQHSGQQNALMQSMMGTGAQMRGQDFNNQQANRGFDVNQLGMNLNQAQGNQQSMLGQQGQMLNANIANQGMGNQFAQNAFAQNSQNQQLNNQNGMNMAQQQNQFNLNNAGQNAQYGQAANGLNQNSWAQGQNNWLQAMGLGQQQNLAGNQNIQNMLGQMFGAFGQATGIGTPQAQTVMQPSMGSQILQGGLGLLGAGMGGGMFGGGTQAPQLPQMQNSSYQMPFNIGAPPVNTGLGMYQPTNPWSYGR